MEEVVVEKEIVKKKKKEREKFTPENYEIHQIE